MSTPNPFTATAVAFAALTLAFVLLWLPRRSPVPRTGPWWMYAGGLGVAAALAGGLIDLRGLLALLIFGGACHLAGRTTTPLATGGAHLLMLAVAAGLFLHAVPGFHNPLVLDRVVLAADSVPYTKYLNFDKGAAGLLLLGLYAPQRATRGDGPRHGPGLLWRFAVVVTGVLLLTLAVGYVGWDPKVPSWWALWLWSMVFLTALPEEAVFRGVAQSGLERWLAPSPHAPIAAMAAGALAFGVAHAGGGMVYVVVATVAGLGYGWIYASTRSIGAAAVAHAGLNTVHFFLFSYPSLR